jgi:hypothetical protein
MGNGRRAKIGSMYAVATFLVVAVITVAITRPATGALMATGVPQTSLPSGRDRTTS